MSVRSHRHQIDGSGEGEELQATPYSDTRDSVQQPISAQPGGITNTDHAKATKPAAFRPKPPPAQNTAQLDEIFKTLGLSPGDVPKSLHSVEDDHSPPQNEHPSDAPKSLRTDGDTIGLLISEPSDESLAAAAMHNQGRNGAQAQLMGEPNRVEDGVIPSAATPSESPHPCDYVKPLHEDQVPPRSQQMQQTSGHHLQQQMYQQQLPPQHHQRQQTTPRLNLRERCAGGGGGVQRSTPQDPPPAYEDTIRQSPVRGNQGTPSPNQSPGSSEDVADVLGALKFSPPIPGNQPVLVTINHFHQPQFQGAGNPVNFGGMQDSAYKQSTLTAEGPHPGGARQRIETGNPVNVGGGVQSVYNYQATSTSSAGASQPRWSGDRQRGTADRKQIESRDLSPSSSSELPEKPGMGRNKVEDDVIIEEDYFECVEDGAGDDNLESPPSDSMTSVIPIQNTRTTMDAPTPMPGNQRAQHTSNQSEVIPPILLANQKVPYTFDQSGAVTDGSLKTNQSKPNISIQSKVHTKKLDDSYSSNQSDDLAPLVLPNQKSQNTPDQSKPVTAPVNPAFATNQMRDPQSADQSAVSMVKLPTPSANQQASQPFFQPKAAKTQNVGQPRVIMTWNHCIPGRGIQLKLGMFPSLSSKKESDWSIAQAKILRPREYQEELAQPANEGYNVINIAPAGTGKSSIITTIICKEHLGHQEPGKQRRRIAIIVPTVVLVEQVYNTLKEYLPDIKIVKRSGEDMSKQPLNRLMRASDIIVMTPMILVNGLTIVKSVTLSDFSLLLFDECHRAMKDSPQVQIMEVYHNQKKLNSAAQLPQIVGLTASPSICGNTDDEKAQDCIMEMCANLDTQLIKTVQQHTAELQEHTHTPDSKAVKVVDRREKDPFREQVEGMMIQIEGAITGGQPLPVGRGHQRYRSYVEGIYKKALEGKRTDMEKCCRHLFEYNKVLQVLDLVRMVDAMEQLEEFQKKLHRPLDEMDHQLRKLYQENVSTLWQLCQEEAQFPNPKMAILKQGILQENQRCVQSGQDFRCMVFVEQRLLTTAIQDWMVKDKDLSSFKPGVLTGARANVDEGGMTKSQQSIAIDAFRSGSQKILISTSIGIEGLNIPACNMVISYSYSMDEVKMIQFRGRARAEESVEMSVGTGEAADKYEDNIAVIEAMEHAIEIIQSMPHDEFCKKVMEKQQKLAEKKDEKEERRQQRKQEHSPDDVRFLCKGCDDFVCYASDIRRAGTQGSDHINPDETFAYFKVDIRPHHDEKKRKRGIKKIYCKKCEQDWGNTFRGHPCLKIESFKCETKEGLRTYKQWKKVNFAIAKFEK
ncbi:uncharacterized protein [Amphiura filiformis]|uniref:uncharacterized protein n=1 Tax=Amphiura filiformis TaxID=82378 RepID=UPI003B217CD1